MRPCDFDEQILAGQISDSQIANHAKTLAAKASAVGMPIAAVYLSGSVVGLSASGITSGLAALGLGGVLGLSSMVTGIGTASSMQSPRRQVAERKRFHRRAAGAGR